MAKRGRIAETIALRFPLYPKVAEVRIVCDFARQTLSFYAPGQSPRRIALWAVFEAAGGDTGRLVLPSDAQEEG